MFEGLFMRSHLAPHVSVRAEVSRRLDLGGTTFAPSLRMPIAKKLVADIKAFAERKPNHTKSVDALLDAVSRIDAQFEGEVRDELLREARKTFLRQIETLENSERTSAALEKLRENQRALSEALKRLSHTRPDGVMLH